MKQAVNAHLSTLLAFFNFYLHELFKEHPELETCSQEIQSLIEASVNNVTYSEQHNNVRRKHHELLESMEEN